MKHTTRCKRFIRSFDLWLSETQSRLPILLVITRRDEDVLEGHFFGVISSISFSVTWELVIAAERDGVCWDFLDCFDSWPRRKKDGGYTCSLLLPEYQQETFPTPEAIWHRYVFEPFEQWVNDVLAPAKWLALYQVESDSTWAELRRELPTDTKHLRHCLPINTD